MWWIFWFDFSQVFHPYYTRITLYCLCCVLGLKEMSVNLTDNVLAGNYQYLFCFLHFLQECYCLSIVWTKKKTFFPKERKSYSFGTAWQNFPFGVNYPFKYIYPYSPYFINSFRKGRSGFETVLRPAPHSLWFLTFFFHDVEHVSHSPLCFAPDSAVIPHISLSPYAFDDTGQHSGEKKLACASVLVFYKAAIYISKYKHGAREFLQWKH